MLQQKDQLLATLEEQLQKKETELDFREKSIEFLHKKILDVERSKMEIQAEKKMLEESFYHSGLDSHEDQLKATAFRKQIKSLEKQINVYKNKLL